MYRSSHPEVFLRKGVPKICSKFTGEHPCRSVILINLQSNFVEITLRHGCSLNLLHIFGTPFPNNTSGWLLLNVVTPDQGAATLYVYRELGLYKMHWTFLCCQKVFKSVVSRILLVLMLLQILHSHRCFDVKQHCCSSNAISGWSLQAF